VAWGGPLAQWQVGLPQRRRKTMSEPRRSQEVADDWRGCDSGIGIE